MKKNDFEQRAAAVQESISDHDINEGLEVS